MRVYLKLEPISSDVKPRPNAVVRPTEPAQTLPRLRLLHLLLLTTPSPPCCPLSCANSRRHICPHHRPHMIVRTLRRRLAPSILLPPMFADGNDKHGIINYSINSLYTPHSFLSKKMGDCKGLHSPPYSISMRFVGPPLDPSRFLASSMARLTNSMHSSRDIFSRHDLSHHPYIKLEPDPAIAKLVDCIRLPP